MAKSCKFGWSVHKYSFITRNWVNFPNYDWIYRTFSYLFVKCFSEKFSTGTVCFGGIQQRIPSQCFWEGFVCQWVGSTLTRVTLGRAIIFEFSKPEDRNCVFSYKRIRFCKIFVACVCLLLLHFTTKNDSWEHCFPRGNTSLARDLEKSVLFK